MDSDGGGASTREDGGQGWESRAELTFEEKGHSPCSQERQGSRKSWG